MNPAFPLGSSATPNSAAQPATAAPSAPSTAAPTDFLLLLAQTAGLPAQQATTLAANAGRALADAGSEESLDPDAANALGLLPISLPVLAAESKFTGPMINREAIAGTQLLGAKLGSAGLDVQTLTEMIESEQASTRDAADALDSFHLPTSATESLHSPKSTAASELLSRPVHAPVGSALWADEIGSRLTLMTEQGKSAASLRLSPEHLGPLEIRISMKDDQASVWFGAAHADTRAAIEHALPRLRELFEAQGMSLADAGVFHEAPREQAHAAPRSIAASELGSSNVDETAQPVRVSIGLVDAYA